MIVPDATKSRDNGNHAHRVAFDIAGRAVSRTHRSCRLRARGTILSSCWRGRLSEPIDPSEDAGVVRILVSGEASIDRLARQTGYAMPAVLAGPPVGQNIACRCGQPGASSRSRQASSPASEVTGEPFYSSFSRRLKQGRSGLRSDSPSGFRIRAASTSSNPVTPNIESAFKRSNAGVHMGNAGSKDSKAMNSGPDNFYPAGPAAYLNRSSAIASATSLVGRSSASARAKISLSVPSIRCSLARAASMS